MSDECSPPVGTPDGTRCVLVADTNEGELRVTLRWHGEWRNRHGHYIPLPSYFRFHSIAEVPHD